MIKTSTRQTIFLPLIGLVPTESLKPADLIGVNKDSYLILDKLPAEYDSRVKAMEVDERPTEQYTDIGECPAQRLFSMSISSAMSDTHTLPHTHPDSSGLDDANVQAGWTSRSKSWWKRSCCRCSRSSASRTSGSGRPRGR